MEPPAWQPPATQPTPGVGQSISVPPGYGYASPAGPGLAGQWPNLSPDALAAINQSQFQGGLLAMLPGLMGGYGGGGGGGGQPTPQEVWNLRHAQAGSELARAQQQYGLNEQGFNLSRSDFEGTRNYLLGQLTRNRRAFNLGNRQLANTRRNAIGETRRNFRAGMFDLANQLAEAGSTVSVGGRQGKGMLRSEKRADIGAARRAYGLGRRENLLGFRQGRADLRNQFRENRLGFDRAGLQYISDTADLDALMKYLPLQGPALTAQQQAELAALGGGGGGGGGFGGLSPNSAINLIEQLAGMGSNFVPGG